MYGLLVFVTLCIARGWAEDPREGFFNSTSYVTLNNPLQLRHIGLSFRSCLGGLLLSQRSLQQYAIMLEVRADGLFFTVTMPGRRIESKISANLLDNEWHTVNILYRAGNLTMSSSGHQQVIANATLNSEILQQMELYSENAQLVVGNGFIGCILQGPSVVFQRELMQAHNVVWGSCPLPNNACGVTDFCRPQPCMMHGKCISQPDRYLCLCTPRYSGNNCQIDNGPPCDRNPCKNGAKCIEEPSGDFTCHCLPGFAGKYCSIEETTQLCERNPCQNNSTCRPVAGPPLYECICPPGFSGKDCEVNINECLSSPCQHGGTCVDGIDKYSCYCGGTGYTGASCENNINECENSPCLNNGICFDNYGSYTCQCSPGFAGQNCEMRINDCASSPCTFPNSVCIDTSAGYQCICKPGYKGEVPNCIRPETCTGSNPCLNGATCSLTQDGFHCACPTGFTGTFCEKRIEQCTSSPCQNGGTCVDGPEGYSCNCSSDFTGDNCELKFDSCASRPCQNNATCIVKGETEFQCECLPGFDGTLCETNINDCIDSNCGDDKFCEDKVNSFECRCKNGRAGPDCSQPQLSHCATSPCLNQATCLDTLTNYTCVCPTEYTGSHCETDVDECKETPNICNNGICVNHKGSYQCFCTPGFSGDHCTVDFNECLSDPCFNGATCVNEVNRFNCICTPGYTGKDCRININECESNPCTRGATCVDGIASFTCTCPLGLTGRFCETNINECESAPCLNGGVCIDGLNSFSCDCGKTGFEGQYCEVNIDDCLSNPCVNGGTCFDQVKGYHCSCFSGFTGVNCEVDIHECDSKPCENGGTCLERSNITYYSPDVASKYGDWPDVFRRPYNYSTAAGFECICVPGINGTRCENNINDCESNPCRNGICLDRIAHYVCECDDGFEGYNCEINIDECERDQPCVHGTCIDKKADYECECDSKYGGKNCSVELIGCLENACHNNGTCLPYLENEFNHKFNCSCPNGFHGDLCEKETTMSLNGNGYIMVNTTREEGYDIQFRFKTTLPNGLLAIGKGSTFYILELVQGKLNLHTSLLNKWSGVFIGSALNDSLWHKVFVTINSSHLVLSANEEQTIYPINLNEKENASQTSFPTTYVGGSISYLRKLTHGPPWFIGCLQDIMINGQWVLPNNSRPEPISFVSVDVGCTRKPECDPNPCHNGGHCTDLWRNFSCTCPRPFLGHTCQYNLTAATFGHENITDSLVRVSVDAGARRAVRSILDISMFIRTREPRGGIFYLGSTPGSPDAEETIISSWIQSGELHVALQFNATPEKYTVGGVRLDDGHNHLIQVIRNVTTVQVKLNGSEYFKKAIAASGQLDLQVLQLGVSSEKSLPNFKGIIQDVQVSNGSRVMVVEFYPLNATDLVIPPSLGKVDFDQNQVLEGVVSDDSCRDEPCLHSGTCAVTWNDFTCICPVGYKGKQCQEMEFCQVQDCPGGSECRNLNQGYECVANVTLHDSHTLAGGMLYHLVRGDRAQPLHEISVSYRSKTGGSLLQVGPDQLNRFFIIAVFKDQVSVWWDVGEGVETRRLAKESPDGSWVTVFLQMDETTITGTLPSDEPSGQLFQANFSLSLWKTLIHSSNITIGGSEKSFLMNERHFYKTYEGDHTNAVEFAGSDPVEFPGNNFLTSAFRGCIGEVRIGGLLLPFFTPEELNQTNADERDHFEMIPSALDPDQLGCILCFDLECANGGKCVNNTESYICECPAGFEGDDCSKNIDECLDSDCKNNSTCVDGLNTYTCECQPGWQGPLCDKDINECLSNPCQNGGCCVDQLAKFECVCPSDFIGETCEQLRLVTCENHPCHNGAQCLDTINPVTKDNYTCVCQEGFVGSHCAEAFCDLTPCLNNGICESSLMKPVCDCVSGYSGQLCEIDIDECASNPCKHQGLCIDGVARYSCNCTGTGYTGNTCEVDIDECTTMDCGPGKCINTEGSFTCECPPANCGLICNFDSLCNSLNPCENGGTCEDNCVNYTDYTCICLDGHGGKNCSEVVQFGSSSLRNVAIIVGPILAMVLIAGAISLTVFLMMARKKRATRGTYSPSSQEYCNPRVELDNVMKPPPEERLI